MATRMYQDFHRYFGKIASNVEQELGQLLEGTPLRHEIIRPDRLLQAMRYATLGGGKRLRTFLLVATARLFEVAEEAALRAAAALEMVHCYSLVHDDLPAMDDDDLRRGRPTVHKVFGEAIAILAGDALLTYAFDVMADEATHPEPNVRTRLVLGLARAAGLGGMAGGQMLDLAAERATAPLSIAEVRQIQAMKTGALLRFAIEAGALLGRADPTASAALSVYGQAIGAAFQIADDLLDAEGDEGALGKRVGKDARRNKPTLVAALGISAARAECDRLIQTAETALRNTADAKMGSILAHAARFVAHRTN
jgi:farnesyl diphosphate synthase